MKLVRENFVPIAVNKQELIHAPGAREKFAEEQRIIARLTGGRTGNLGVYLVTPDGESLTDKQIFRQPTAAEVLTTLREALARFGPVTPRQIPPTWQPADKGVGVWPDGSVQFALTVRHTDQSQSRRPVFDSLVLTSEEWRSLLPSRRDDGTRYTIPDATARRFARAVSPSSDLSNLIRPADLTEARLTGVVRREPNGGWSVRLVGEFVGQRIHVNGAQPLPGRMNFEGVLVLDDAGRPLRLLLVGDGTFKMPWERSRRPTASLVEWHASSNEAEVGR